MIYLFTDGSSSRKFETIGFGILACKNKEEILFQEGFGFKNSHLTGAAELLGILFGLSFLADRELQEEEITLYCDSQYAVNEINEWFRSHLQKYFQGTKNSEIIINILYKKIEFKNISIKWIRGHTGEENFESWGNNIVDNLAVEAHKGVDLENLEDFKEIINDIKNENQEEKFFDKIYKHYIINGRV